MNLLFIRADRKYEEGKFRSAFLLFLAAAEGGEVGAQVNLGNLYAHGTGVTRNRTLALYWYRRAWRRGADTAASNIGNLYRNESQFVRALDWFERAVKMGDVDANLDIAKICVRGNDRAKAVRYVREVCKAKVNKICEASREEAQSLLESIL